MGPYPGLHLEATHGSERRIRAVRRQRRGWQPSVFAAGPPVALTSVGGDANDTMLRLEVGMARGSRSLPILLPFTTLGRSHGRDSSLVEVNLAPSRCRPSAVQEGSLLLFVYSRRMVAFDIRAVGDDHALCGIARIAWCPTRLSRWGLRMAVIRKAMATHGA